MKSEQASQIALQYADKHGGDASIFRGQVLKDLGVTYLASGRTDKAATAICDSWRSISISSDNVSPELYRTVEIIAYLFGEVDDAPMFMNCLELVTDEPGQAPMTGKDVTFNSKRLRGIALTQMGQYEAALLVWPEYLRLVRTSYPSAHFHVSFGELNLARTYIGLGRIHEAKELLEMIVRNPMTTKYGKGVVWPANQFLGEIALVESDFSKAEKHLAIAVESRTRQCGDEDTSVKAAKLFRSYARALRGLGRDVEADRYESRAKNIESHISEARDRLKMLVVETSTQILDTLSSRQE